MKINFLIFSMTKTKIEVCPQEISLIFLRYYSITCKDWKLVLYPWPQSDTTAADFLFHSFQLSLHLLCQQAFSQELLLKLNHLRHQSLIFRLQAPILFGYVAWDFL